MNGGVPLGSVGAASADFALFEVCGFSSGIAKNREVSDKQNSAIPRSIVKKSAATITSRCCDKNSFHVVFRSRSGAGSSPCSFRMFATRLASAPWIPVVPIPVLRSHTDLGSFSGARTARRSPPARLRARLPLRMFPRVPESRAVSYLPQSERRRPGLEYGRNMPNDQCFEAHGPLGRGSLAQKRERHSGRLHSDCDARRGGGPGVNPSLLSHK